MNNEFFNLKDQQVLYEIKDYLAKISVPSTLFEATIDLPFNLLIAVTSEQVSVNIMYVPLPEDHFKEIRLFQFYSLLAQNVPFDLKNDLLILLNELNDRCPIGCFFTNEKQELGFKYIFPVPRFEITKEHQFTEVFTLYLNSLMSFRDIINQFINRSLTLKNVLTKLEDQKL
jgi:hypothetical protein